MPNRGINLSQCEAIVQTMFGLHTASDLIPGVGVRGERRITRSLDPQVLYQSGFPQKFGTAHIMGWKAKERRQHAR
jgi:hypothetical protein